MKTITNKFIAISTSSYSNYSEVAETPSETATKGGRVWVSTTRLITANGSHARCRIHTMTTKAPEGWSATGGHWLLAWRLGVETSRGDVREREVKQINVVMHSA
jgi:hypothetical protein